MKSKALATVLMLALMTGCANQAEKRLAWEVKPIVDVRHGMAQGAAQYQLGQYHQRQGNMTAAEAAFTEALVSDPGNIDAHNALGRLYAERGDLERSAQAFRRVAEMAPGKAYLHNNIGYALYLQGRHTEAIDALRKAIVLSPDYDRAWVNLRTVAEQAGMTELATLAAQRRLPGFDSQRSRDADVDTQLAASHPGAEPEQLRLALTPTLKLLTEPTIPPMTLAAAVPVQDILNPTVLAASPDIPVVTPVQAITVIEAGEPMTTLVPSQGPVTFESDKIDIALPTFAVSTSPEVSEQTDARIAGRVELANGNGVAGFATQVGRQLRKEGVRVSRITNYRSYAVKQSYIEYRGEWSDAAYALRNRLGTHVAMKESKAKRSGSDVRVVLGGDSPQQLASMLKPRERPDSPALLLSSNDR